MSEPHALQILIQIAGAAALLIWAVRLVRIGVERGFAAPMRSWLRHSSQEPIACGGDRHGCCGLAAKCDCGCRSGVQLCL